MATGLTIGSELRAAREQLGFSLKDISDRTNIRQAVLRSIEDNDFDRLPRGVITRGFVKLYAREVGLDADEIGKRYAAGLASGEGAGIEGAGASVFGRAGDGATGGARTRSPGMVVAGLGLVALLVVAYAFWTPAEPDTGAEPAALQSTPPATSDDAPAAAGAAGVATSSTPQPASSPPAQPAGSPPAAAAPTPPPEPAAAGELRVSLRASGECWVSATADGEQVAYRVLNPGERIDLRVRNSATLRIGMPANLSVTINDRPIKPFDRPNAPATLRITPANYLDLLGQ